MDYMCNFWNLFTNVKLVLKQSVKAHGPLVLVVQSPNRGYLFYACSRMGTRHHIEGMPGYVVSC